MAVIKDLPSHNTEGPVDEEQEKGLRLARAITPEQLSGGGY